MIVQSDQFPLTQSVTTCSFTSTEVDAGIFRVRIEPSEQNGLRIVSFIMVDKVTTIPRAKLGRLVGRLNGAEIESLNRVLAIFLGLAG